MLAREPNAYVIRAAGPSPTSPANAQPRHDDLYGITSQRHVASIFAAQETWNATAIARTTPACVERIGGAGRAMGADRGVAAA